MRLLIYGAGVIGCWYAVLFSKVGYDTTIYARGKRLELLRKDGLRYEIKGKIHKADVKIIERLENEDIYDFIFLTVKENQVHTALKELAYNVSPNIVTMINTIKDMGIGNDLVAKDVLFRLFRERVEAFKMAY